MTTVWVLVKPFHVLGNTRHTKNDYLISYQKDYHNSSSIPSNAVPLEISCRCIATLLSYSFLFIIPLSCNSSTRILRRVLISSERVNSLPVTFLLVPMSASSSPDFLFVLIYC